MELDNGNQTSQMYPTGILKDSSRKLMPQFSKPVAAASIRDPLNAEDYQLNTFKSRGKYVDGVMPRMSQLADWQDQILGIWYAYHRRVPSDTEIVFFRGLMQVPEECIKFRLLQLLEEDRTHPNTNPAEQAGRSNPAQDLSGRQKLPDVVQAYAKELAVGDSVKNRSIDGSGYSLQVQNLSNYAENGQVSGLQPVFTAFVSPEGDDWNASHVDKALKTRMAGALNPRITKDSSLANGSRSHQQHDYDSMQHHSAFPANPHSSNSLDPLRRLISRISRNKLASGCGPIRQNERQVGSYPCSFCGRLFRTAADLFRHEEIIFPQQFYFCFDCGDLEHPSWKHLFTRKDKMRDHISKLHSGQGNTTQNKVHGIIPPFPNKCELCLHHRHPNWKDRCKHIVEHCKRGEFRRHAPRRRTSHDDRQVANIGQGGDDDDDDENDDSDDDQNEDDDAEGQDDENNGQGPSASSGDDSPADRFDDGPDKNSDSDSRPEEDPFNSVDFEEWLSSEAWKLPTTVAIHCLPTSIKSERSDQCVHPIRWLGGVNTACGTASLFRVDLPVDLDTFEATENKLYTVKHYHGHQRHLYEREVEIYTLLKDQGCDLSSIIRCYGTFEYVDEVGHTHYNMVLQYIKCSLDDYFTGYKRPRTIEEVIGFWTHTFSLAEALGNVHDVRLPNGRALHGRHGNINPGNIFYVDGTFKLSAGSFTDNIEADGSVDCPDHHISFESRRSKSVGVITGTPYVRPQKPKIKCQYCNDNPDGFLGIHELDRHVGRAHGLSYRGYVCTDSSSEKKIPASYHDTKPLTHCRVSRSKKTYGAYYNAAAHLRRAHVHPRTSGVPQGVRSQSHAAYNIRCCRDQPGERPRQASDISSLGRIFLEVATWMRHGVDELQEFDEHTRRQSLPCSSTCSRSCSHNERSRSEAFRHWIWRLNFRGYGEDKITPNILRVIKHCFLSADATPRLRRGDLKACLDMLASVGGLQKADWDIENLDSSSPQDLSMPIHWQCPGCRHSHRSARMQVDAITRIFRAVQCDHCLERWTDCHEKTNDVELPEAIDPLLPWYFNAVSGYTQPADAYTFDAHGIFRQSILPDLMRSRVLISDSSRASEASLSSFKTFTGANHDLHGTPRSSSSHTSSVESSTNCVVLVQGLTGSGKSTFVRAIAQDLACSTDRTPSSQCFWFAERASMGAYMVKDIMRQCFGHVLRSPQAKHIFQWSQSSSAQQQERSNIQRELGKVLGYSFGLPGLFSHRNSGDLEWYTDFRSRDCILIIDALDECDHTYRSIIDKQSPRVWDCKRCGDGPQEQNLFIVFYTGHGFKGQYWGRNLQRHVRLKHSDTRVAHGRIEKRRPLSHIPRKQKSSRFKFKNPRTPHTWTLILFPDSGDDDKEGGSRMYEGADF